MQYSFAARTSSRSPPRRIESVPTPPMSSSTPYVARDALTYGGTPLMTAPVYVGKEAGAYSGTPVTTAPYIARDAVAYPPLTTAPQNVTYGTPLPMTNTLVTETETASMTLVKHCFCEFFGTLLLFFVVVLCTCASFFYIAFFYVALIYAFWFTSGAHLNPAISLAMVLARRMHLRTFWAYIISQFMGAAIGGLLFHYIFHGTALTVTVTVASTFTRADALYVQFIYTTMLTFVALNVTCTELRGLSQFGQFYGIAIGFVILAGGAVACTISKGALFNPALCVGLMTAAFEVGDCFWYVLVELLSALVGALLYLFCRYYRGASDLAYDQHFARYHYSPGDGLDGFFATNWFPELLGTFWFVLTVVLNVNLGTNYSALSGGGALVSMIYALGFSGGCFNPAVTFAMMVSGHSPFQRRHGIGHIVIQLVAAILAGIVATSISKAKGLYITSSSYSWGPVVLVEFFFTLVLAYVVLVMTVETETHRLLSCYYALAIGFVFFGASEAAYSISGGYLNPALALAFAVNVSGTTWAYYFKLLWYWVPEFLGAWIAGCLLRWLYSSHISAPATWISAKPDMESTPIVGSSPMTTSAPLVGERQVVGSAPLAMERPAVGSVSARIPATAGYVIV